MLGLIAMLALESGSASCLDEVVAAVEHQQPGVIETAARPGGGVERGPEAVASVDRGDETLLIGEHG